MHIFGVAKNGKKERKCTYHRVHVGMKQRLFSFTQAMLCGWSMQGDQTKQVELFIALTHENHKPIIFDIVLKARNSVLLGAKMVIRNPEKSTSTK